LKVANYREQFKNESPQKYNIGVDNAYQMMDRAIVKLTALRESANELI